MHLRLLHVVFILALTLLSACGRDYRTDPILDFNSQASDYKNDSLSRQTIRINPYFYGPNDGETKSYYRLSLDNFKSGDEEKARYYRNALLEAMIVASDNNTSSHLASLKATQASVNVLFGAAALGLTGGAAVAPAATASALAAASTGVQGARALINEEVYSQAFAESIIMLVTEDRKATAATIRLNYTKSMTEYPIERAIADVSAYHESGSVYYGLALARQAIEKETIRKRGEDGLSLSSPDNNLEANRARLRNLQLRLDSIKGRLDGIAKQLADTPLPDARKTLLENERASLTSEQAGVMTNITDQKKVIAALLEAAKARLEAEKNGLGQ